MGEYGATLGSRGPSRRGPKLAMQIGVPVLVFAALTYVIAKQWSSLPNYRWHFSAVWLVASAFTFFGFYLVNGLLWHAILHLLGGRLRFRTAQAIFIKSLLARYVPGNMLMIIGRVVMAEREGVSRKASLTSIIYEIPITFCAAALVASYFLITLPSLQDIPMRWVALADIPLTLIFLHPKVFQPIMDFILNKFGREPLPTVLRFREVLVLLIGYSLMWTIIGLASYLFIRSVFPLSASDILFISASYALAWSFAVITFISPSGLGTRDVAYYLALRTVLPSTVAAAIAIGARIFQTLLELVYAAAVIGINRARVSKSGGGPPFKM